MLQMWERRSHRGANIEPSRLHVRLDSIFFHNFLSFLPDSSLAALCMSAVRWEAVTGVILLFLGLIDQIVNGSPILNHGPN